MDIEKPIKRNGNLLSIKRFGPYLPKDKGDGSHLGNCTRDLDLKRELSSLCCSEVGCLLASLSNAKAIP